MNTQRTQSGFTLIEMMVSVALFAVVISVALPTMLVVMKASARAQALQTTIDNTAFAIDAMSRQVRLGRHYRCTNDSINATQWNQTIDNPYADPLDCTSGASTLIFTDQYGKRQAYRHNAASSTLEHWSTDANTWIQLTSPKVLVNTAVFTVTGSSIYDGISPIANFIMRGASRDEAAVPEFTLSTSMTQYVSERGFAIRRLRRADAGTTGIPFDASSEFGSGIANIGDVDGDTVSDLVVGKAIYNANQGGAHIILMQKNGAVKSLTQLNSNTNGMPTFGSGEQVGSSVAAVGDIDGDSSLEILLGAPGSGEGAMYLTTVQSNGTATSTIRLASGVSGMPTLAVNDQFGASIAPLASRAIIVGAPGDDTACSGCGAVHLITFTGSKTISASTKIATGLGLTAGDGFGSSVAFLGYDTLGQRIVAIGAAGASCASGAFQCGALYIIHLTSGNSVASFTKITSSTEEMPPLSASNRFGVSVAPAGDLNSDGVADIIVGAEETTTTGSAYILFMNSDESVKGYRDIASQGGGIELDSGDMFGRAVANIGDLNGDFRSDFMIGAPGDDGDTGSLTSAGALYLLFGK